MKNYLKLITLLTVSQFSYAQEFTVNGNDYLSVPLGNKVYIYSQNPEMELTNDGGDLYRTPKQVNCKSLDRSLKTYSRILDKCLEDPESPRCEFMKSQVIDLAHNHSFSNGPAKQYWQINTANNNALISTSAVKRALRLTNQEVVLKVQDPIEGNSEIESIRIKSMSRNSRIRTFQSLFNLKDLIQVTEYGITLTTENRLLACDLMDKDIQLEISFKTPLEHTESVAKETKDMAFKVYQSLRKHQINPKQIKPVQAAYIGFVIGSELEGKENKSELNIETLFKKLINTEEEVLKLNKARNYIDFVETHYPDKNFSKTFSYKVLTER